MPQLSIKGEDLNFLVYRYLVENGYQHSAFCFRNESNLPNYLVSPIPSRNKPPKYPPQCLISLIYKAILFIWVETHTDKTTGEEIPCDAPFNLFKTHICSHGGTHDTSAATSDDLFREDDEDEGGKEASQTTPIPSVQGPTTSPSDKRVTDSPGQMSMATDPASSTFKVENDLASIPIPRKVASPHEGLLKREIKSDAMIDTPPSDTEEPISSNRRRRIASHTGSLCHSHTDQERRTDPLSTEKSRHPLATESPQRSSSRPGRPRKENTYQVIRRGVQGQLLGFRVDRDRVIIGKKVPPDGWRVATVLTSSSETRPKRVEVNSAGRLMVVLWAKDHSKCYDCHLYEIDQDEELQLVKLGPEAQQLTNIRAIKFSSSRLAFRIILAGRRDDVSIYKTFGKHGDIWKLESEEEHPA